MAQQVLGKRRAAGLDDSPELNAEQAKAHDLLSRGSSCASEASVDLKRLVALVKEAGSAWVEDRAASMGAALSYYSVFSVAPLLLIVIAVAGLVFGDAARSASA